MTALGSANYVERNTVEECMDFCLDDPRCVGVDVDWDLNPKRCWSHFNEDDFKEDNIYAQPGTTSYQLITRCAATVTTGS